MVEADGSDSETDQREDRFYFKEVHFLRRLRLSTLAPKFQSSLPSATGKKDPNIANETYLMTVADFPPCFPHISYDLLPLVVDPDQLLTELKRKIIMRRSVRKTRSAILAPTLYIRPKVKDFVKKQ